MERKDTITVTGIMSGTSLDGLDVARVRFSTNSEGEWKYNLLEFRCFEFPPALKGKLSVAMELSGLELMRLGVEWSEFASECTNEVKGESELVSSHGHTVFHQPDKGLTVQIGNGATLSARVHLPVVCDLRSLDVAYGGTGAPLIPIVDELLFSEYDACVNLGGFSNISMKRSGEIKAWDIGPCNNLLNLLAREAGKEYDKDGEIAASGEIHAELLCGLLSLEYHKLPPPKSLGMEWMHDQVSPVLEGCVGVDLAFRLNTSVEYVASSVADALPAGRVLFTGGGARNLYLMNRIRELAPEAEICVPKGGLIDAKEAIGFAFLGLLRWRGEENVRTSVTGARMASSGGAVWLP